MDSYERKKALQEDTKLWNDIIIKEQRAIKDDQHRRDKEWIEDYEHANQLQQKLQRSVDEQRRQREKDTAAFNIQQANQVKLNKTKQTLKDELPPRLTDDDPRCGPASMQKFAGEDINANERRRLQQDQMRRWMTQMVDEKDLRKWSEKEKEKEYHERLEEVNYRAYQEEENLKSIRRARAEAVAAHNLAASEQKKDMAIRNKFRETQLNLREIQNALDSDLLTESPQPSVNVLDATRFRPDHMKGYLPSQRQAILNDQAAQRFEKAARKQAEKEEEKLWASHQEQDRRAAILLERARERERRAGRVDLANQQKMQHEERLTSVREF